MKDIIIDAECQLDSFTFRLNPGTRIKMKEKHSGICPASSVFVSYEISSERHMHNLKSK